MNAVLLLRQGDTRGDLYRPLVTGKTIAISFVAVGELYVWSFEREWGANRVSAFEEMPAFLDLPPRGL